MTKQPSFLGAWQGGTVSSLALSPNFTHDEVLLAATSAGIFRSDSAGARWALAMTGFDDPSAVAVASGQTQNGVIFLASSEQGRLFRSLDLGESWTELISWAGLGVGAAIAISPDFATDKTILVATANGIFRSLDQGITWQEASFGLLDLDVICLALAPDFADSQSAWVGTALGGLFRTRNAGRAWRESGEGLPDCAVQAIVLSPNYAEDQTIYAGMEQGGVYRSQDGGRSWDLVGNLLTEVGINALATIPQTTLPIGYLLLAGSTAGIFSSTDGGETWQPELADLPILDLAFANNHRGFAAVYQQTIWQRDFENGTWQTTAEGIIAHAPPQVVQNRQGILLALDNQGDLACAHNGDAVWQAVPMPDAESPTVAIASATVEGEECFYAASLAKLYCLPVMQSVMQDEWHRLLEPPLTGEDTILQLAVCDKNAQLQIVIGTMEGKLFWLDDERRSWQQLAAPGEGADLLTLFFAADEEGTFLLHCLTIAENEEQNYAIELWRYTDEWSNMATLESEMPAVLTLATTRSILLATQNRLIRLFTDPENGELAVTQHFFDEQSYVTAFSQSDWDGTIFLATTQAIYVSTDEGMAWQQWGTLPNRQPIVAILPHHKTGEVHVVSLGGTVARYVTKVF